jgi:hypothetical protein
MADWFSSLAQQALKLADDIADSIATQATEAQEQLQTEKTKMEEEERKRQENLRGNQLLPWETNIESRQILSDPLMEKVMSLPLSDRNFLEKAANSEEVEFSFNDFIPVALKLLQIDLNLARTHAKLSPKMNEEIFWFNYYCRVSYLRAISGIEGPMAQKEAEKWKPGDIIIESVISKPSSSVQNPYTTKPSEMSSQQTAASKPVSKEEKADNKSTSNLNSIDQNSSDNIQLDDLDLELENMKDIELDELGDINPEDYEEIGSSDCMDELEAQIAKELEEEKLKNQKS